MIELLEKYLLRNEDRIILFSAQLLDYFNMTWEVGRGLADFFYEEGYEVSPEWDCENRGMDIWEFREVLEKKLDYDEDEVCDLLDDSIDQVEELFDRIVRNNWVEITALRAKIESESNPQSFSNFEKNQEFLSLLESLNLILYVKDRAGGGYDIIEEIFLNDRFYRTQKKQYKTIFESRFPSISLDPVGGITNFYGVLGSTLIDRVNTPIDLQDMTFFSGSAFEEVSKNDYQVILDRVREIYTGVFDKPLDSLAKIPLLNGWRRAYPETLRALENHQAGL